MIPARKSLWFERIFALYNRNLMRRRFHGLRVAGLEHLRQRPRGVPLLLYANHSSWWDGLVAFEIGRAAQLDHYVMMEEQQLRQYKLFSRLGAFSVIREDPRAAFASINYAADLLRGAERALWIFPQGAIQPNDTRPLSFYTGAARIAARAGAIRAAPVAIRYEFLQAFKPEIYAGIGAPELIKSVAKPKQLTQCFAANAAATLEQVRQDILAGNLESYQEIVAPR
jgi:1-acyl-sn-glycerol-3-phosphate acyltransferase